MASGIVEVFAKAGYDVTFVGRGEDKIAGVVAAITKSLDKAVARGKLDEDGKAAVLGRLTGSTEREALADADIIVEAIAEDLDIKLALFADLDRIAKPGAILATTTSSLSINACAAATKRPQDVIGMHFFNPAAIMKLVEVVTADETSVEVDETVRALCLATGKHPVSCGDRAGFIVNALLFPYLNDAIKLHEAGGGSLDEIDEALKATKLPMGPFQLLDVVGNDVSLAIQQSLVVDLRPRRVAARAVARASWSRRASWVARPARASTFTELGGNFPLPCSFSVPRRVRRGSPMGVRAPSLSRATLSAAGWIRFSFRAVAVGLVAGVLVSPIFGVFDGTQIDMVTRPNPGVAVEEIVAEQQRGGLSCQKEPELTNVVVFQRNAPDGVTPAVEVLTFDEALAAARAGDGWVLWYCV